MSHATPPLYPAESYGDPIDESAVGAFATETMAELYIQQGFPDRALAIYRELAVQRPAPDNASLLERVAELEQLASESSELPAEPVQDGRTAREFFGALAYRRAPRAASEAGSEDDMLADTEAGAPAGEQVAEFFAAEDGTVPAADEHAATVLADAFAEGPDPDPAGLSYPWDAPAADDRAEETEEDSSQGRPARAAEDALSLDDVFRDGRGGSRGGLLNHESGADGGVSFDEFFARRENGDGAEPTAASADGGVTDDIGSVGESRDGVAEDAPQDLELFHAWLEGLKS